MSTLKRSRRRELILTPSFTKVIKSKISSVSQLRRASKSSLGDNRSIRTEISHTSPTHPTLRPVRTIHPIHAIHYLPPEILAHIFCIGASETDEASIVLPVIVSQVCGAWRDLALATNSLWCRITLDPRTKMWTAFMQRSRICLLDITLSRPRILDVNTVSWYMHLVSPHIRRWRSFTVHFDQYAPFLWNAALSSCCGTNAPVQAHNLEELTLIYPQNDDDKIFTIFGGVAHRLRKLTVGGLRLDWIPSLFQNLTFLDYSHHGFTRGPEAVLEVLNILRISHRLQEMRISFGTAGQRENYLYPLPEVTLPCLQRLCIRVGHDVPAEITVLIGYLQLPALQSLRLRDASRSKHPFTGLKAFSRSLHRPQSLAVLDLDYGWWEKRFIATFNGITKLMVNGSERWRQY